MEFDKPDKEVQRPRGNDVADQACSRLCGGRGELREASSVAAAVSAAEERAAREPTAEMPEMATTHQGFEHCCKYIILAGLAELASLPRCLAARYVSDWLFPRNFIK